MFENHRSIKSMFHGLLAAGSLVLLSACATNGVIHGRLDAQPVALRFHHTFWHQDGTISTELPGGEHFAGKFVVGTHGTTGVGVQPGSGDIAVFSGSGNTSNAAAVLFGDRGHDMHCSFMLAKPDDGLEGGGVGHCKVSTGQEIAATF